MDTIVESTPRGFWQTFRDRLTAVYEDTFEAVLHDAAVLDDQKLEKLRQDRFFRLETLLYETAETHGMPVSTKVIGDNQHNYVLVNCGGICLTQCYVPTVGDLPKPAKFRERLSMMSTISDQQRLLLGDEPVGIREPSRYFGLLTHNPIGSRFNAEEQRLGHLQFGVPWSGCTSWAARLLLTEIVSSYLPASEEPGKARPKWKQRRERPQGEA